MLCRPFRFWSGIWVSELTIECGWKQTWLVFPHKFVCNNPMMLVLRDVLNEPLRYITRISILIIVTSTIRVSDRERFWILPIFYFCSSGLLSLSFISFWQFWSQRTWSLLSDKKIISSPVPLQLAVFWLLQSRQSSFCSFQRRSSLWLCLYVGLLSICHYQMEPYSKPWSTPSCAAAICQLNRFPSVHVQQ